MGISSHCFANAFAFANYLREDIRNTVNLPAGAPLQLKEKHLYNKFLILLWFYGFLEEEQ